MDSTTPQSPLPASVAELLARGGVPGASIALVRRDGSSAAWAWGNARLAPRRPADLETVFHLFSGSKLYTATALMRLVERGALHLEDPIEAHLPELRLRYPVTVRQLACHDSGLPETLRAFLAVHLPEEPAPSTAEVLARFRLDVGRVPGRGVAYRNANYAILGELISRVGGCPYERFVEEEVLAPLGSAASFTYGSRLPHAATGYMNRFDPMRWLLRALFPSLGRRIRDTSVGRLIGLRPFLLDTAAIGGLVGTALDFVPLLKEMLSPTGGLLSAESKRAMLQVHGQGGAGVVSRVGVGLGWKRGEIDGVPFWNHEGGGPGFCSETRLYPDGGLGVVVLTNRTQTRKLSRMAHRICEALRCA